MSEVEESAGAAMFGPLPEGRMTIRTPGWLAAGVSDLRRAAAAAEYAGGGVSVRIRPGSPATMQRQTAPLIDARTGGRNKLQRFVRHFRGAVAAWREAESDIRAIRRRAVK